tara:strand:+ start:11732 stop:12733 length:1002 start_codon:yes stop_codon:yes gene_type:complete
MKILLDHNIQNSLKINSKCRFFIEINDISEFVDLYTFIKDQNLPVLILGEGTNIVSKDYFDGIVVKPKFDNINYDKNKSIVSVGSSVNWHFLVKEMLIRNIYGFENLSLIPGSVGACPIQNIGAYGQEVSSLISKVECFDYKKNKFLTLFNSDCDFSYRNSSLKNKPYIIYNIDFITDGPKSLNLEYKSIQNYVRDNNIDSSLISLKQASEIIVNIRNSILPDPNQVPNAGSFFKNPTLKEQDINTSQFNLEELIIWPLDSDMVKVGAARLIQLVKNDLKDYENVSTYSNHALVLISNGKASQLEILNFANNIKEVVNQTFNIKLDIEPTVIN